MSSRRTQRLVVSALAVCTLLTLAAPAAQARESAGFIDALAAKLHALVPAWWPGVGARTDAGAGLIDPNGGAKAAVRPIVGGHRDGLPARHGRGIVGPVRPACNGIPEPNGTCI
jgi:hypothetical protein